jgi:hypothetical protein
MTIIFILDILLLATLVIAVTIVELIIIELTAFKPVSPYIKMLKEPGSR